MLDDRRSSLIAAVEEALSASSLRKLAEAEASRSSFSSPPPTPGALNPKHANGNSSGTPFGGDDNPSPTDRRAGGDDVDHHTFPSSKAYGAEHATSVLRKARRAVRFTEGAAAAAEREYAKRARDLVRMRAVAALKERQDEHEEIINGGAELRPSPPQLEPGGSGGMGRDSVEAASPQARGGGEAGNSLVECGGCAVLFEANERLLQEAKARGFLG